MVAGMEDTGQRCDEPLHEKKEGCSTQDTLAEPDLGGITRRRWNVCPLMDRTSPERAGCCLEHVAVC
jgi:hypothetical protein